MPWLSMVVWIGTLFMCFVQLTSIAISLDVNSDCLNVRVWKGSEEKETEIINLCALGMLMGRARVTSAWFQDLLGEPEFMWWKLNGKSVQKLSWCSTNELGDLELVCVTCLSVAEVSPRNTICVVCIHRVSQVRRDLCGSSPTNCSLQNHLKLNIRTEYKPDAP